MSNTTKSKTTTNLIQVRIPADLKERTSKIFAERGFTTSDVIRMMLIRADRIKDVPFAIRPNTYPYSPTERLKEVEATFEMEDMPLDARDYQEIKDYELAITTTEALRDKYIAELRQKYGE